MDLEKIEKSKIYDLGQSFSDKMPILDPRNARYFYGLYRHHTNTTAPLYFSSGLISLSDHIGTHIDALCHVSQDGKLHNDIRVAPEVETPWGYLELGAEKIPPLLRPGVLLDIARYKGLDVLPKGYEVSSNDLRGFCEQNNITIEKGSVVLVRVGNGKYWSEPEKYLACAGIAEESNMWLSKSGVVAVGADNLAWDLLEGHLAGHRHLIVEKGIYVMENLYLEELSSDSCYKFLFIALPLKLIGATGSPIRPIALKT